LACSAFAARTSALATALSGAAATEVANTMVAQKKSAAAPAMWSVAKRAMATMICVA